MITVVKPGLLSTIQDQGRFGYQAFGMPVAGAMDDYAAAAANALAGNQESAAVIEMTFLGGEFRFDQPLFVAIAGADMQAALDGQPVANWSGFTVKAGSVLSFNAAVSGCRTYLAVQGGFDVPKVMGSRSTYTRAKIGGVNGRALIAGDILKPFAADTPAPAKFPAKWVPSYETVTEIRVILGPQDDLFTHKGIETFFNKEYTLSSEADRMGYRFEGDKIEHRNGADIVSDALPFGAVQIPGHGSPIIMMADRQTTGGYAKIATVIRADRTRLAQLKPGDKIKFISCSEEEAIRSYNEQFGRITEFRDNIVNSSGDSARQFIITVNQHHYDVKIRER